jgi:inorganic pyrophosphatase
METKALELAKSFLGKEVEVTMDRPIGSRHPKFDFEYKENYGYIDGVDAPDGEFLDAFFLGAGKPLEKARGMCIAIAHRKDDDDDKLIVVAPSVSLTDKEIMDAIWFQEQYFDTEILR